jgi:AAA15 family ATPase/GTPase
MLLSSFYLENFRLFDKLEVKRLGRINLIVGRNNAGKSAFLEAVYIYAAKTDPEVFSELIQSRQEHWKPRGQDNTKGFSFSPFRHFFKGHKIPLPNESGFKLAISKNVTPLHVKTAIYVSEETENGFSRRKLSDSEEIGNLSAEIEVYVVAEQENNTQLLFSEERGFDPRRLFLNKKHSNSFSAIQLVPTQGISDRKTAQLWDAVNLTDLEQVVIDGLKLIEVRLLGLAFVEDPRNERLPLVKLQDQEERVPLKSLGDGVTRVFHIMLALVNAKDGILLIDEFENGLHWTVQESVWRVLFLMAAKLNVQVFCTTHSRDCIMAFDTVWQEFENEGAFFRLYAHDNEIRVREYDLETLSDSLETDVDVR